MRSVWAVGLASLLAWQPAAVAAARAVGAVGAVGAAQTHLVVVSGLSGEPKYRDAFDRWAATMIDAAENRYGVPAANIVYLAEHTEADPGRIYGRSTTENVESLLSELSQRAEPNATVFILLIGHGSSRAGESRFNLPGPDMTAADFARALQGFPTQKLVLVNAASASGEFILALSGPNRAIVTATKSGFERNETLFGGFFVEAYAEGGADVNKDGRISVLEAFEYARREVARAYERENKLLTEHALLDDNGDGVGSREPDPTESDGALARNLFLVGAREAVAAAGTDDPELAALYSEKAELERRIAALRAQKDAMDPALYDQELETLLVELALTTRAIREREEKER